MGVARYTSGRSLVAVLAGATLVPAALSAEAPTTPMACAGQAWFVSGALEADVGVFDNDRAMAAELARLGLVLVMAAAEDGGCAMDDTAAFEALRIETEAARDAFVGEMTTYGTPAGLILRGMVDELDTCVSDVGAERLAAIAARFQAGDIPCGWQP